MTPLHPDCPTLQWARHGARGWTGTPITKPADNFKGGESKQDNWVEPTRSQTPRSSAQPRSFLLWCAFKSHWLQYFIKWKQSLLIVECAECLLMRKEALLRMKPRLDYFDPKRLRNSLVHLMLISFGDLINGAFVRELAQLSTIPNKVWGWHCLQVF